MLEKIGMAEADLRCGAHLPFNEEAAERMLRGGEEPTQLHNNCSGKHAGMLAVAKQIGADAATYENCGNPVQQGILDAIADLAEVPKESIAIGIDGCAAPNFALPLSAMAVSFLNLISPPHRFGPEFRAACTRIVNAMIDHPEIVGGTERLDTLLMRAAPGRIVSKIGAEGVWVCGVLPCERWPLGLGIALKIEDGDDKRARPVVAVELLRRLGVLPEDALADLSPLPIRNRRGDVVGRVEADLRMLTL
jgi:L-asparaginase II